MPAVLFTEAGLQAIGPKTAVLRHLGIGVQLGVPAVRVDPETGTAWLVYDDPRISLLDAAYGAVILGNAETLDVDPTGKSPEQVNAEVRSWAVQFNPHVPEDIPENADPWQYTLQANGAPSTVQCRRSIPEDWSLPPSEDEAL